MLNKNLRLAGVWLTFGAVGLSILLPMMDHHWAERVPGHVHLALTDGFNIVAHAHAGEVDESHHHGSPGRGGGDYVAFGANDAGSAGELGVVVFAVANPSLLVLLEGGEGPGIAVNETHTTAGVTVPPEAPPPRSSL